MHAVWTVSSKRRQVISIERGFIRFGGHQPDAAFSMRGGEAATG
jgi:hypothetical protein